MKVEISPGVFLQRRDPRPFARVRPSPFFGFQWFTRYLTGAPPNEYLVMGFTLSDGLDWYYLYGDGTHETALLFYLVVTNYPSLPPDFGHYGGYYFNAIIWGAAVGKTTTPPP